MVSHFSPNAFEPRTPVAKDGAVLLDLESDRLLKLNSVGAEMWRQLHAGSTEAQVVHDISVKYAVDQQVVARDLSWLLKRTKELRVEPGSANLLLSEQPSNPQGNVPSSPEHRRDARPCRPEFNAILVCSAFLGFAIVDFGLWCFSLQLLCQVVHKWPLLRPVPKDEASGVIGRVCDAVEKACVWYPKKALCLQRSAVTACLLRIRGVAGSMVIGARPTPFLAHAWVEVDGFVVNDSPRVKHFYHSLSSY